MIHIACAAEGSYIPHSAAMLHSALAHRGDQEATVHYLHGPEFPQRSRDRLRTMIERSGGGASFVEIDDARCAALPTKGFTRKATWYRIFLPELLPDIDRILYLDSDLVVLDSLAPLWEIPLSDQYVAAVTNVFEPWYEHRARELGLAGPEAYFNAGVLLMNLERMRLDRCTRAVADHAAAHSKELLWRDQDALNVVLGSRRLHLHPRWNGMNSVFNFPWSVDVFGPDAVREARENPAIRHFEGPSVNKPWHYMCERALRDVYFDHRRRTPWPRCRLEGVTPRNVARRLVSDVRRRAAA